MGRRGYQRGVAYVTIATNKLKEIMAVDVKGPNITGLRELQDLQTNRLRAKLVKKTASNSNQSTDDNLFLQVSITAVTAANLNIHC